MKAEYSINISTLTELAVLVFSTRTQAYYATAQKVLLEASAREDPTATIVLVALALQKNRLNSDLLRQPWERFLDLVTIKNPTALFFQAQINERCGLEDLALEMYVESTEFSTADVDSGAEFLDLNLGDVWRKIGLLRKKKKDLVGAEEAFKKAALEFDDPLSYLHLATEFTDSSSSQYENYLLRAASDGEPEAIEKLGSYYFKKVQKYGYFSHLKQCTPAFKDLRAASDREDQKRHDSINGTPKELVLLEEWLQLGVDINGPFSQVYRGILHRASGQYELGLGSLQAASESPHWINTVAWLEKMWYSKDLDVSNLNIEELRKKKDGGKYPSS